MGSDGDRDEGQRIGTSAGSSLEGTALDEREGKTTSVPNVAKTLHTVQRAT